MKGELASLRRNAFLRRGRRSRASKARERARLGGVLGSMVLGIVVGCSQVVVIPASDCPYEYVDYTAIYSDQIREKIATALEGCGLRSISAEQAALLDEAARKRVLRCSFTSSSSSVQQTQVELKPSSDRPGDSPPELKVSSRPRVVEIWADVALGDSRGETIYAARGSVDPATSSPAQPAGVNLLLATDRALQKLTEKCQR